MEKREYNLDELKKGVFLAARGGGVRSCVSIGVLKLLEENEIPVKGISGESLASMFAALLATGHNADQILDLFIRYNKVITRATPLLRGRGSIVIDESVCKETNNATFKDAKIDCYINASYGKLLKPQLKLFSKEETPNETFGTACRASASLPVFFGRFNTQIDGVDYDFSDGGSLYNPYIPATDLPIIYSNFHNGIDYYRAIPMLHKTIVDAKEASDIVIDTPVGGTLVTCSEVDMIVLAEKGYQQAKMTLKL